MIKFGTVGTANITTRALIYPCLDEPHARVVAIAARDKQRAQEFARWHGVSKVCENYQSVIEDASSNAFYNPLPISMHREWTIKALEAGKHVLCEKSFASNAEEAKEMVEVASRCGLVVMDAFHYRYHPVFKRAKEVLESGELGAILHIEAAFHVPVTSRDDIRMDYSLGGGVTMDIGCYPISWVRHLTGEEPEVTRAVAIEGPKNVDTQLEADFLFPSGITAKVSGDMREGVKFRMEFRVVGEKGTLHLQNPLVPQNGHSMEVLVEGDKRIETLDRRPTYSYQLDAFLEAVESGASLYTDGDDAIKQMQAIDKCYEHSGLPLRGL